MHRPKIHCVDHLGATSFIGLDSRRNPLKAAPARSVKAYSGQCRSDPDDENDCIDPDYAQEGGREQQSTYTNHDLRDDHALPTLLSGIGQGVDLSFEIGDLLVEVSDQGFGSVQFGSEPKISNPKSAAMAMISSMSSSSRWRSATACSASSNLCANEVALIFENKNEIVLTVCYPPLTFDQSVSGVHDITSGNGSINLNIR
ncbi:hypothetical protein [Microvirga tunisiensis]|uniref:Uncharacterized protein n=1 Tax=Microvirga tunisiensis TaxID=2108360 RepID=A0A5N7MWA2_9HYPH|nr:hypothetical protein [Microvirga tunisiensis]MPR13384.1 hypothetical protein [Microvirga tunisiensis]MPR31252.1 hypothetical protein [Microvirga tunisiensis]